MVRTSPWPTVLGTAALIALPVLAAAQTGSTGAQTPPSPPKTQSDTAYPSTAGAAVQHLTEAKQILDSIPRNAVTGRNAAKMNQIRREFAALQRTYNANPSPSASTKAKPSSSAKRASASWNTHLMALDRDLTALLGPSGSASAAPGASGTAGTSGTSGAAASASLDADVRSKLEEFRTHITQFAAAASGTTPGGEMSPTSPAEPTSTEPTSTQPTQPATTSPATPPATSSTQASSATGETAQAAQPASSSQADASAARQHLTEARQSLADLTALPQAQQLQGEARTQVSQLISQFNQLITTQADWKASYDQVNATLTTLLASSSASSTSSSSTSGAVGTTGTVAIDPAIRAKLEEFRTRLQAFYTAAGGDAASASGSMSSRGSTSSTGSTASMSASGSVSSSDVETHIAAIERILDQAGASSSTSTSTTTGTAGSTTNTSRTSASGITLTQQQIDEIRMHLQQLRNSLKK